MCNRCNKNPVIDGKKRCIECRKYANLKSKEHRIRGGESYKLKHNEDSKRWAKLNPDKVRNNLKRWKINNPDKAKIQTKKYRENHKEQIRLYRFNNKEKYSIYYKEYYLINNEKFVEYRNKRRTWESLSGYFTAQEWVDLCNKYDNKCLACGIKSKYTKQNKLSPDHVIPLSRGGSNIIDNIQPLCWNCNKLKFTKTIDFRYL